MKDARATRPMTRPTLAVVAIGTLLAVTAVPGGASAQSDEREVEAVLERFWAHLERGELAEARELIHPADVAAAAMALREDAGVEDGAGSEGTAPAEVSDAELFARFFEETHRSAVPDSSSRTHLSFELIGWTAVGEEGRAIVERRWEDVSTSGPIRTIEVQPVRRQAGEWRLLLPHEIARQAGLPGTTARLAVGLPGPRPAALDRFRATLVAAELDAAVGLLDPDNVARIAGLARRAVERDDRFFLDLYYDVGVDEVVRATDRELARWFLEIAIQGPLLGLARAEEVHVEGLVDDGDTVILAFWSRGGAGIGVGAIRVREIEGAFRIDLTGGVLSTAEALLSAG